MGNIFYLNREELTLRSTEVSQRVTEVFLWGTLCLLCVTL
jgi:hypothetical protein